MDAAEPYALPNIQSLVERGLLAALSTEARPHALPIFAPKGLPDSPNHFTHRVVSDQPFYYNDSAHAADGPLASGTKVRLVSHGDGSRCRVVDATGLHVVTVFDGLRPIRSKA